MTELLQPMTDAEVAAMQALVDLDPQARERVLRWAGERFRAAPAASAGKQRATARDQPANGQAPAGRRVYTVEEAAEKLRKGRTRTWGAVRTGEVESFKIGARRLISQEAIEEFIRRSETASIASRSRTGPAGCGWCPHPAGSHWEVAEPGGPRAGCGVAGCQCPGEDP